MGLNLHAEMLRLQAALRSKASDTRFTQNDFDGVTGSAGNQYQPTELSIEELREMLKEQRGRS